MKTKVRIKNTAWGSIRIIAPIELDIGKYRLQFYCGDSFERPYINGLCERDGEIRPLPVIGGRLLGLHRGEVSLTMIMEKEQ